MASQQQIEGLKSLFGDLFAKLMSFALEDELFEDLGASLEVFYNLEEGEEYEFNPSEEFLFLTWFLIDDTMAEGESLIDVFLARHADTLSLQEKQVCNALKETHLTLLQVLDVKAGESLSLRDVFLGEEFEVLESVGSETATKGTLLFTRVLRIGDLRFLVGAGVFLDSLVLEPLTQFITDQYRQECEEGQKVSFKQFLKENGELINWWIRAFEKGEILTGDDDDPDGDGNGDGDGPPELPPREPADNA
ncbi:MAG: hypothetical protein GX442_12015 [Candidatus Riflebacteria bacterium]|nr:hypothetical protein [Candidatus Riflebacteria bacterium]